MSIALLFKMAAVGILVTILSQILKNSGREEYSFFVVGDDWVGKYDYLKELGVTVFYFPRGEGASSTGIKKQILEQYENTMRKIDHQPNPDVVK